MRRLDDCVDVPSLAALVLSDHVGLHLTPDHSDPWLPLDGARAVGTPRRGGAMTVMRGRRDDPMAEGGRP